MVTLASTSPESGSSREMTGAGMVTVKVTPALGSPSTVTTTSPWWLPPARASESRRCAQPVVEAVVPLKVTVPEVPKLEPSILTLVSTSPESGSSLEMIGPDGGGVTVKVTPALDCPPAVLTTTGPVVAPSGTRSRMAWSFHWIGEAVRPLKVTVPVRSPKLEPWILTSASTKPESGSSREMTGAGRVTVKETPALDCPPSTVTTTGPEVAPCGTLV